MLLQRSCSRWRGSTKGRRRGRRGTGLFSALRRCVVPAYDALECRSLLSVAALYQLNVDGQGHAGLSFTEQGPTGPDQLTLRLSGGLVQYTLNGVTSTF